jgi:predicted anti-sigma-YlaC factor YlaD
MDSPGVQCESWQESISAVLDGEDPHCNIAALDQHLASCTACAAYRDFSHAVRRGQMGVVEEVPDLSGIVAKQALVTSGDVRWRIARGVLAVCAVEVIVFSLGDLVGSQHDARHLGAFSVAFGVALMAVVAWPARARMMLPVAGVLAMALSVTAIVDLAAGRVPLVSEARHIPEIVSVGVLWMLAAPVQQSGPRRRSLSWSPRLIKGERDVA